MSPQLRVLGRAALCAGSLLVLVACGGGESAQDQENADRRLSKGKAPEGLHIVPLEPRSFHELRAGGLDFAISFGNFEADEDPRSKFLVWKVNAEEVHRGISLPPGNFNRGDEVELVQLTEDGKQVIASYTTTILNSAPRVTSATVRSKPDDGSLLECNVGARDDDNDPIYYEFEWKLDGSPMPTGSKSTVDITNLKKGQKLEAVVTAFDGSDRSEPFQTAVYLIDNLPPRVESSGQASVSAPDADGKRLVRFPIHIEDPDGDRVDVDVSGSGAPMQWVAVDGVVQWAVEGPVEGRVIHVRVSDGRGATVEKEFQVEGEAAAR